MKNSLNIFLHKIYIINIIFDKGAYYNLSKFKDKDEITYIYFVNIISLFL